MSSMDQEAELLVGRLGSLGTITLNRPAALNSLTLGMVHAFGDAMDQFEANPDVAAVLVEGAGDRAFCAGGDIREIYESGKAGSDLAERFWRDEYRLNARIHHFPKPYITLLDGITMGGGVGLAAHGSHRVATERLRLAMPETGIGFFPDVGTTWLLGRAPDELGTYLGLTGRSIGAKDAIEAGLLDAMVPHCSINELRNALSLISAGSSSEQVWELIGRFIVQPNPGVLAPARDTIRRCFSLPSLEDIVGTLEAEGSAFADEALTTIRNKSPSALRTALRLLRLGKTSSSLEECLNREFAAAINILSTYDFYEGIRAAVVDKDRKPVWNPFNLRNAAEAPADEYSIEPERRPFDKMESDIQHPLPRADDGLDGDVAS